MVASMTSPSNYVSMQFLYFNNLKFRRPSLVIEQVSTVPLDFSQLGIHGFASNKFLFRRKRTTHASVCRKAEIIHAGLIEIHHILIFRRQIKAERHIHRDPTYSFEIHFRHPPVQDTIRFPNAPEFRCFEEDLYTKAILVHSHRIHD